ncbi:hypothetical protein LZ554_003974 [Drepanopeziza brunnea f. sp. 'monogermtubi']|nr:hypothetical protein LZ554_003974 [Drepanopeziza brunnea f. sp. 'monogermtubi']
MGPSSTYVLSRDFPYHEATTCCFLEGYRDADRPPQPASIHTEYFHNLTSRIPGKLYRHDSTRFDNLFTIQ